MFYSFVKLIGYQLATVLAEKLLVAIKDIFIDKEIEMGETSLTNRQLQRKALMQSIKDATNNEQRKQLSIILADHAKFDDVKLPNANS